VPQQGSGKKQELLMLAFVRTAKVLFLGFSSSSGLQLNKPEVVI